VDDVDDVDAQVRTHQRRIEGQKNAFMQAGQAQRSINAMNCLPNSSGTQVACLYTSKKGKRLIRSELTDIYNFILNNIDMYRNIQVTIFKVWRD
jgi:hypothetical protein